MKKILVTGGAGYIGSHITQQLLGAGFNVRVFDSLENGHIEALPKDIEFIQGNLLDFDVIKKSLQGIDAVIHFAAYIEAGDSMNNPLKFFENNFMGTANLLDAMRQKEVNKIVFSSTAAVYGEPEYTPIDENHSKKPTNIYGLTKLQAEKLLDFYDRIFGLKYITLRYFNAAGADESGEIGEDHSPETHLIPLVLQTALGKRANLKIFGTDYPTKDGTCVRDYIHIKDLGSAHVLSLEKLLSGSKSTQYNLGNSNGYSVREIIDVAKKVTGRKIHVVEEQKREGDPAILIASSNKAIEELGWQPKYGSIEKIIETAWDWHRSHQNGYQGLNV
ncbi:UDP-glucose 4-epimerase GalE [candidate division WS5 bacterium]|uniref:UDP-glucose 4-epimerase n=1 Tax=candidate division WS5 bacterium TaxID=2093353 RepID=A0A419DGJ3_9BACT|nr:MAG: UDP-glucose 4-epimerase GalE [candidate division WS5 bacterium]